MRGRYSLLSQRDGYGWGRVTFRGTGIGAWFVVGRISAGDSVTSVIADYENRFTRAAVRQAQHLVSASRRLRKTETFIFHRDKDKPLSPRSPQGAR